LINIQRISKMKQRVTDSKKLGDREKERRSRGRGRERGGEHE
jgi:hypothetical protein